MFSGKKLNTLGRIDSKTTNQSFGDDSDDGSKSEDEISSSIRHSEKKKSLVRRFSLANGVKELKKTLKSSKQEKTDKVSPKPFNPRNELSPKTLAKGGTNTPNRKHSDGADDESSSMVSDSEGEEVLGLILQDCIVKMKEAMKEGKELGIILKERESDLIKSMELARTKVRELTQEIPHLPVADQGREQQVLDNLNQTLMEGKDVVKQARLSNNSGSVFMNALLDRAETAERKERECREVIASLEQKLSRISLHLIGSQPERKDSTGEEEIGSSCPSPPHAIFTFSENHNIE